MSGVRGALAGSRVAQLTDVIDFARRLTLALALVAGVALSGTISSASSVSVRYREGVLHGFLALSGPDGRRLAEGDLIQTVTGDRVTSRLVFHFKDGSLSDETTVFTERGHFRLITDRLIQRGPSFPTPLELSIDTTSGNVSGRYSDTHGQQHAIRKHMQLPDDLANGLVLTLLKNVGARGGTTSVSMIAATPQPRIVHLNLRPAGTERFTTAGTARSARLFNVHVDLGGLTGLLARLAGKQPPDSHVWILEGQAPAFVKSEQPFYAGGPLWRIELVSPQWPDAQTTR